VLARIEFSLPSVHRADTKLSQDYERRLVFLCYLGQAVGRNPLIQEQQKEREKERKREREIKVTTVTS